MGIISCIKEKQKIKSVERNDKCNALIAELSAANNEANSYVDSKTKTNLSAVTAWGNKYSSLKKEIKISKIKRLRKTENYTSLKAEITRFKNYNDSLEKRLSLHNDYVEKKEIYTAQALKRKKKLPKETINATNSLQNYLSQIMKQTVMLIRKNMQT